MKKKTSKPNATPAGEDMQPEYDLRGGTRGKHYEACREGHTVKIHNEDGTITEQRYIVRQGTITLDPDVREYFPDSEKVNAALRAIIAIMPGKRPSHPRRQVPRA
jgi:hypothetical protein